MKLPDELEAALFAAPNDPGPWLVAGDWLMSKGDPLGELITLMRALEHEQNPAAFLTRKQRRDELLRLYGDEWSGGAALDHSTWRWGFITQARLEAEHVDAFVTSRLGRYVRELEIHGPLDELADTFARTPLPLLEALALGRNRSPATPLARLTKHFNHLKRLGIFGSSVDFTGFDARALIDLRVRDAQHPSVTPFISALGGHQLRRLELDLDCPLELKTAVVQRSAELVTLALEDDLTDELARWAAKAPIMRTLESLTLVGPMTDEGLDALLIEAARLHRLKLTLEGGAFSSNLRRMAYRQLPTIVFNKSRTPPAFFT